MTKEEKGYVKSLEQKIVHLELLLFFRENLDKEAQNKAILKHLKNGFTITPLEAVKGFGCLRLAARISNLRALGHDIKTEMVVVGKNKRVARYSLNQ